MIRKNEVLLIDDDPDSLSIIELAITKSIYEVKVATIDNGTEALTFLTGVDQGKHKPPRIIILDLYVPGREDGLQLLKDMKTELRLQNRLTTPVVVFSQSMSPSDIDACYELGANAFITKPSTFDEFVVVFERFNEYWFKTSALPDSEWRLFY